MRLDLTRARRALETLAREMRVGSAEEAAEGVVRVVEGNMERAIRTITVERGQDPRLASLMPFGGAAGLHACGLAKEIGFADVLVPRDPGLLSARGVLDGRVILDRLVPLSAIDPSASWLASRASAAIQGVRGEVVHEGFAAKHVKMTTFVRARYQRQSIELEVPLTADFRRRFDEAHRALFHACDPERPLEVVGLRVSGSGEDEASRPRRAPARRTRAPRPRPETEARVWFDGRWRTTAIHLRESLVPGSRVDGPAIVAEYSSTTVVAPGWTMTVDEESNLRLTRRGKAR